MLVIKVVDNFLRNFDAARKFATEVPLINEKGPDGHQYDNMAKLSGYLTRDVILKMHDHIGKSYMLFAALRASPQGIHTAYRAHSDAFMGCDYSLVLYLNATEHCQGGTSFLRHRHSDEYRNYGKNEDAIWWPDRSDESKWENTRMVEMRPNRGIIFDSSLIHQSEPCGGFGENRGNSRTVIIAFFKQ